MTSRIVAGELRQMVEKIERLNSEKSDIAEATKEVYAEIKGQGYDPVIVRKIVALRKKDPAEISEEEAVLDMYKTALGM